MKHYILTLTDEDGIVLDRWHTWTDRPHPTPDSVHWQDDGPHTFQPDDLLIDGPGDFSCTVCGESASAPQHKKEER